MNEDLMLARGGYLRIRFQASIVPVWWVNGTCHLTALTYEERSDIPKPPNPRAPLGDKRPYCCISLDHAYKLLVELVYPCGLWSGRESVTREAV